MDTPETPKSSKTPSSMDAVSDMWRPDVWIPQGPVPPLDGRPRKVPRSGYRSLATWMGLYGSRLTIFRRFGDLNMLSLLSLQAELMDLRHQLEERWIRHEEMSNAEELKISAFSFSSMLHFDRQGQSNSSESSHSPQNTKTGDKASETPIRIYQEWELIKEIRQKLRVYSKCPYNAFLQSLKGTLML